MDGMTQLQALTDDKGNLRGLIGYRNGLVWHGVLTNPGPQYKIIWYPMQFEAK